MKSTTRREYAIGGYMLDCRFGKYWPGANKPLHSTGIKHCHRNFENETAIGVSRHAVCDLGVVSSVERRKGYDVGHKMSRYTTFPLCGLNVRIVTSPYDKIRGTTQLPKDSTTFLSPQNTFSASILAWITVILSHHCNRRCLQPTKPEKQLV